MAKRKHRASVEEQRLEMARADDESAGAADDEFLEDIAEGEEEWDDASEEEPD